MHLLAVTNLGGSPDAGLQLAAANKVGFALGGFGSDGSWEDFEEELGDEGDDVIGSILDDATLVDDAVDNGESIFENEEGFVEVGDAVGGLEEVDGDVAGLFDGGSSEHVDILDAAEGFAEREKIGALSLVPALVENEIGRRNGAGFSFVFLVGDDVRNLIDEFTHLIEELFGDVCLVAGEAERGVAEGGAEDEACGGADGFDAGEILEGALEEAVLDHGADGLDFGFLCVGALENVLDGVDQGLPQVSEGILRAGDAGLGGFVDDAVEGLSGDEPGQEVH